MTGKLCCRNERAEEQSLFRRCPSLLSLTLMSVLLLPLSLQAADIRRSGEDTFIIQQQRQEALEQQLTPSAPDVRLSAPGSFAHKINFPVETPCFQIKQTELKGADALPHWLPLQKIANGAVGHCLGAKGINLLMSTLQNRLVDHGYVTTRVLAPSQDLKSGILRLVIIPGVVRHVRLTPDSDDYIQLYSSFPAHEGSLLDLRDIEQGLENMQRLPGVQADMEIVPGEQPGESDILITRKQDKYWRLGFSLDDSGTRSTGRYLGGITFSLDNPFSLSDLLYVSATHNFPHYGGKGSEKGNGTTHTETTVDAGNRLTIISGRDTTLTGAQAGGETVKVDAGRHLTLTSEQDSDRYDSKQQNASAGGSFTFGSMSGSASVSLSRDKMHSNYDSVQEQTGIFAGRGGFDVTTGQHTQLNGAVIASTATADKNRLDTGTLGFSDIENRADFKTEHQSAGLSTGGSVAGNFLGNMANNLLVGANHEGHADSTTQSAVSAGNITIRDTQSQKQDVADLNRDAAHANQTLSPIFDREKEQQRLQQAQLIGEIGNQVADIARTEGQIAGEKAKRDPAALNQARAELEAAGKPFTEQDVAQRAYNNGMAASGFGTGGKYQQAIQAATAAVQGLAGGNLSAALAGGAAPYLAEVVKTMTTDPVTGEVNKAANVAAHAVVNAALAVAQGNNALAGAAGAATGEVVGMIATQMYGKPVNELSETEKQTVSTLATVAAGLAGGLVGDSGASAVAGAQSGKTTVENNALSLPSGMVSYGQAVASWNQYADANNLTPEQKLAGLDKLAKGELPDGANISKVIVDGYKDGVLIAGAWYLGPAASVGKVIGGGVIAEIANGTYQWFDLSQPGNENKNWDWKSSASAGITGMLAPGRTVGQNVGIAMGSAFFTDGPNAGAIGGAAAGAWAGGLFGEYAPGIVNSVTGKEIPGFVYDYWGGVASEFSSGFIKDLNKPKGSSEDKKK